MAELKMLVRRHTSYDDDFHAWTVEQASRLRTERPRMIDWENLAEEVESLRRSDRRAPHARSESWSGSIEEHRDRIARVVADSPALPAGPPRCSPSRMAGRGGMR